MKNGFFELKKIGLKKAAKVSFWILLACLFIDALLFNGQHYEWILLLLFVTSVFSFVLEYKKPLLWSIFVSFSVVIGLIIIFYLFQVSDERKDSLAWQIGGVIGLGIFCSALCLLIYSLSFPLYKYFPDQPILTKRLHLLGKICVALPILSVPLIIALVVQQFYHRPYEVLADVTSGLILFAIVGSVFPWGFMFLKSSKR